MPKRMALFIPFFVVVLAGTIVYRNAGRDPDPVASKSSLIQPSPHSNAALKSDQQEQALAAFIASQMTGPKGIYTNLKDTDQSEAAATGHEYLSESASLMMRYAVLSRNKELFTTQWRNAKETFNMAEGFSYRYSPKLDKLYPVTAAIDDLRLIRSLYEAGDAFKEPAYIREADQYGARFYKNHVKNGFLYDFYDENYKTNNSFITLCYINLKTLGKLSIDDEWSGELQHNMQGVIEKGYLSDAFPFYETRFTYDTQKYSSENINTVESLLTILSLAEVGMAKASSIDYIEQQVEEGKLYGQYTRDGVPTTDIRSTAIYAITAMIGSEIGDEALYLKSIARMNEFRVQDKNSTLYGGFGDVSSKQAYSFDNLMALLAYRY